jgi:carbamoyl-phosphate synthase large subunit
MNPICQPSSGRHLNLVDSGEALRKSTVLLTCAGRRTSLLKSFQKGAHARGGRVLAADNDPLAPTLYLADSGFNLPRVLDPEFLSSLLSLVQDESVRMIVPTIDTELPLLAQNIGRFESVNCILLVSSPKLIDVSSDKWLTMRACEEAGIRTPRSWLPNAFEMDELPDQIFVKPRDGSASQNTYSLSRDRLSAVLPLVPNAIIQEKLEGHEITIDSLLDLDGRPIHYVPRRRLRTLAGESIEGVTIDDEGLRPWLLKVLEFASAMGGRGPLTIQAFLTKDGPVLTEINARFGGGYPLTHAAGGNYAEWILRNLEGEILRPSFGSYRKGLYMTRYYVEHFTEQPLWS